MRSAKRGAETAAATAGEWTTVGGLGHPHKDGSKHACGHSQAERAHLCARARACARPRRRTRERQRPRAPATKPVKASVPAHAIEKGWLRSEARNERADYRAKRAMMWRPKVGTAAAGSRPLERSGASGRTQAGGLAVVRASRPRTSTRVRRVRRAPASCGRSQHELGERWQRAMCAMEQSGGRRPSLVAK